AVTFSLNLCRLSLTARTPARSFGLVTSIVGSGFGASCKISVANTRIISMPASTLSHLECSKCGTVVEYTRPQHLCQKCAAPLLARYDLAAARTTFDADALKDRANSMWRYEEVLPPVQPVTLGEGMTPLIHARRLGDELGLSKLYIKDEGQNPTNSFKARG